MKNNKNTSKCKTMRKKTQSTPQPRKPTLQKFAQHQNCTFNHRTRMRKKHSNLNCERSVYGAKLYSTKGITSSRNLANTLAESTTTELNTGRTRAKIVLTRIHCTTNIA